MAMKDYYKNDSNYQIGEEVTVFDVLLWNKNGGDNKTGNFRRPGKIVKIRKETRSPFTPKRLRLLADIKFNHRNNISKGHFLYGLVRK